MQTFSCLNHKPLILILLLSITLTHCKKTEEDLVWINAFKKVYHLNTPRAGAGAVVIKNHIYLIGGIDGKDFINTVEYAKILDDGTIDKWYHGPLLNIPRGFLYAVQNGRYVFAIGGANGKHGKNLLNSVEVADIKPNGEIGKWRLQGQGLNSVRRCAKGFIKDDYLFVVGGYNGSFIDHTERAKILSDGDVVEWRLEPELLITPRYIHSITFVDNICYAIGGHDEKKGSGVKDVEMANISNGHIQKWRPASPLISPRYGLATINYGKYIYAIGGISEINLYLNSIEVTKMNEEGSLYNWRYTTPMLEPRENASVIIYKDRLYVIGGTNATGFLDSIEYALINREGEFGYYGSNEEKRELEPINFFTIGTDYLNNGLYKNAIITFKKAIEIKSDFIEAYHNLGSAYLRDKDYLNALDIIKKEIAIKPDYKYAFYNLACVYSIQGKVFEAVVSLKKAVELGYSDFHNIITDPDLANIREEKAFKGIFKDIVK